MGDEENDEEHDVEQQLKDLEKLHKTPRDETDASCADAHNHGTVSPQAVATNKLVPPKAKK